MALRPKFYLEKTAKKEAISASNFCPSQGIFLRGNLRHKVGPKALGNGR